MLIIIFIMIIKFMMVSLALMISINLKKLMVSSPLPSSLPSSLLPSPLLSSLLSLLSPLSSLLLLPPPGYVIIDNLLTKEQLKLINDQINNMNDRFTNNDNDDDTIRNDKIYWVGETNKDDKDDPLLQAIRILRSIPYELNMKHGVPMICQLSCFDKGGKYVAHRDVPQVMDTHYTLSNLLLYMLSIVNTREITIVLYLNSLDWDSTNDTGNNNGNLRLYVDAHHNDTKGSTSTKIIDIPPLGGRVIIFNSSELLHEVLPSKNQRIALTLWCGGRSSRNSPLRNYLVKSI